MRNLSEKLAERFVKSKVIAADEKDLYVYGLQQWFYIVINIIATAVIGLFFKMILEMLLFTICYICIRRYAGGYHARNEIACFILGIVISIIALFIIKYFPPDIMLRFITMLFTTIIIIVLSPVEDKNKPLDDLEKQIYKVRALICLAINTILILIFFLLSQELLVNAVLTANLIISVMLLLGKLKNLEQEQNSHFD